MLDEIKKIILTKLTNQGFKHELVHRLNSNINIPFISEKTEGKILLALVNEVTDLIEEQLDSE